MENIKLLSVNKLHNVFFPTIAFIDSVTSIKASLTFWRLTTPKVVVPHR